MEKYLISPLATIKEALKKIDLAASKILFVTHDNFTLLGVISDGDIRRAILKGLALETEVSNIINTHPTTVFQDYNLADVKKIMLTQKYEAIPVVNTNHHLVDILFWNKIFNNKQEKRYPQINVPAVIMAGGKGTRLKPFTQILPKPLIPIGEKPIIEVIMDGFARFGIKTFYISLNFKGRMIKAYFEDIETASQLNYVFESKPLGTAGALKLLQPQLERPFFVTNCDILIKEDYTSLYNFHLKENNTLTLVASMQHHKIPYGVCEIESGGRLKKITEKPEYDFLVNTGMYVLNPETLELIPSDTFFNMPTLIEAIQKNGGKVGVYPVSEKSWIDVGQWSTYQEAIRLLSIT